ncbi:neuromedin-B isoform X2 [Pan troglodytes]|uniref:neuromedin-B isoform X2 n=1 Tax=Pan troglodytes TaxID=9598 RepID=UPI000512337C|nr:neuromedin-B isoform X2 [Pan troglodytes]
MARRAGGARMFGSLLLFALLAAGVAPLSWDLPEPRSRASKIRVHSRGNLWATGTSSLSTSYPALFRPLSKQPTQLAEFLPGPGPSHLPASCAILSTCSGKAEGAGFATTQTPLWLLGEVEAPRGGRLSIFPPQERKRGRDEELFP